MPLSQELINLIFFLTYLLIWIKTLAFFSGFRYLRISTSLYLVDCFPHFYLLTFLRYFSNLINVIAIFPIMLKIFYSKLLHLLYSLLPSISLLFYSLPPSFYHLLSILIFSSFLSSFFHKTYRSFDLQDQTIEGCPSTGEPLEKLRWIVTAEESSFDLLENPKISLPADS